MIGQSGDGDVPGVPGPACIRGRVGDCGQSTVELALVLPVLIVLALVVVQVGLVARDQVTLHNAAHRAARRAAVEPTPGPVADSAAGSSTALDADRVTVELHGGRDPGDQLTVVVRYRSVTQVPLVGALIGDIPLQADAVVRVE